MHFITRVLVRTLIDFSLTMFSASFLESWVRSNERLLLTPNMFIWYFAVKWWEVKSDKDQKQLHNFIPTLSSDLPLDASLKISSISSFTSSSGCLMPRKKAWWRFNANYKSSLGPIIVLILNFTVRKTEEKVFERWIKRRKENDLKGKIFLVFWFT